MAASANLYASDLWQLCLPPHHTIRIWHISESSLRKGTPIEQNERPSTPNVLPCRSWCKFIVTEGPKDYFVVYTKQPYYQCKVRVRSDSSVDEKKGSGHSINFVAQNKFAVLNKTSQSFSGYKSNI